MTAKQRIETLRSLKIYNDHDLIKAGCNPVRKHCVYIRYRKQDNGRGGMSAAWQVVGSGFNSDPEASWYNYGCKTFLTFGKSRSAVLAEEAKPWIAEKYQIQEWERSPFGGYQEKGTLDRAIDHASH